MTEEISSYEKGKTGEDFVNQIAFKSFMKHWCYTGPIDIMGDRKEICDLLVIFDTICIIISVKNYSFKDDYEKYFKRTTDKAIRQIRGAERKLFGDQPILLKHPDKKDLIFEKDKIKEIYRVVVNINTTIKYFQTSYFQDNRHYIVLDSDAWLWSMNELNSLPDFIDYLSARCELFAECPVFIFPRSEYDFNQNAAQSSAEKMTTVASQGGRLVIILGSEIDLVAHYIMKGFQFPNQNQLKEGYQTFFFQLDGAFEKYSNSEASMIKAEYERESFFLDDLMRRALSSDSNGYLLAEMLLKLSRIERASFAREFLKYHDTCRVGDPELKINAQSVMIYDMPMLFVFYQNFFDKAELDAFLYSRVLHYQYLRNFDNSSLGILGMSNTSDDFVFGFAKVMEPWDDDEVKDLEQHFRTYGWKLRDSI